MIIGQNNNMSIYGVIMHIQYSSTTLNRRLIYFGSGIKDKKTKNFIVINNIILIIFYCGY